MKKPNKISIIIIIGIILLTIGTVPKTLQEDTYYMIKVGEYICQNGMKVIDERIEPFGWVYGLTYTYPHWLLDIVFYQIYNAFDFTGIYIFTILSGILIYTLIYITNVKIGKNYIISGIITIASIYILIRFYNSSFTNNNIHMYNTRNTIYRKVFRIGEKGIFNRTNFRPYIACKLSCSSVSNVFCSISSVYSRIYNSIDKSKKKYYKERQR